MHFSRRTFLGSSALALSFATSALGKPHPAATAKPDADFRALLDRFANAMLDESPETVTYLGLDHGARAGQKSQLGDDSRAFIMADAGKCRTRRNQLLAFESSRLGAEDKILFDTVMYAHELGIEAGNFAFGNNTFASAMAESASPYVMSQQAGAFNGIPEFLDAQHLITTKDDAESYVARVAAFGRVLDQESERFSYDADHGVIPPDAILTNLLGQLQDFRAQKPEDTRLVTSLARRMTAKGINGAYTTQVQRLVSEQVYPAIDRQIAAIKAAQTKATHDAGAWKLPNGEAYYVWALKVGTSTNLTADEIHKVGLAQNQEIEARMDGLLQKQGLSQGSVGERMSALTKDPRFIYANTDDGRTQLLNYLEGRLAALRPLVRKLSHLPLKAEVQIKRVPTDIQDGAALGYMNPGSLDGTRPAIYYINLKDMALWPKWQLPSLTAHEAIPGHAWQGAYITENAATVPLITSLMGFNAYVEGWALYAEQLADEYGYYTDDPFGQLGYLQAQKFRAARLVVDTGLHAKRWGREQAIDWMTAATGRARGAVTSEVDRYSVAPGQACGYKVGHNEIIRLRAKAKAALGKRFDIASYNDAVVKSGGVPLTVLAHVVDNYIATGRA